MNKPQLLLDTNIVIDFLNMREPFFESAHLLMALGKFGELDLWISSSQVTGLVYVPSNGERRQELPEVLQQLQSLRTFVNVLATSEREIDAMLGNTWKDPEDFLLYEIALALNADAVISRNQSDFPEGFIPVMDCDESFSWMEETRGLAYSEIGFQTRKGTPEGAPLSSIPWLLASRGTSSLAAVSARTVR